MTNSWTTYNLPKVLKERGVDDVGKLPNFHYREDALKLWTAIEEFVNNILAVYYHSDDDIKKVTEAKIEIFILFSCSYFRFFKKYIELYFVNEK